MHLQGGREGGRRKMRERMDDTGIRADTKAREPERADIMCTGEDSLIVTWVTSAARSRKSPARS